MPPTPTSTPEARPARVPSARGPADAHSTARTRWKAPEGLGATAARNAASAAHRLHPPATSRTTAGPVTLSGAVTAAGPGAANRVTADPVPAGPVTAGAGAAGAGAAERSVPVSAAAGGPSGTATAEAAAVRPAGATPAVPGTAPAVAGAAGAGRGPRAAGRPGGRRDLRRPGGTARPGGTRPGDGRPGAVRPRPPAGSAPDAHPRALPPHVAFAERLLAVLTGERPVHWMLGHTVGEAYEQLIRLAPANPLRPTGSRGARPVLRRCGGSPLRPGVVEAYATVATGARVRAMAFRLERGQDLRWRCAAVDLGPA
ncbi:Rv3235 family protein [Streptomyces sp. NPDC050585]|uniref:Rv3235 family protein n=2 Tax=unclassified Streptomyces TaxID=2593676 RepID=UPI0037A250EF